MYLSWTENSHVVFPGAQFIVCSTVSNKPIKETAGALFPARLESGSVCVVENISTAAGYKSEHGVHANIFLCPLEPICDIVWKHLLTTDNLL